MAFLFFIYMGVNVSMPWDLAPVVGLPHLCLAMEGTSFNKIFAIPFLEIFENFTWLFRFYFKVINGGLPKLPWMEREALILLGMEF